MLKEERMRMIERSSSMADCLVTISMFVFLVLNDVALSEGTQQSEESRIWRRAASDVVLSATLEYMGAHKTQSLWQLPREGQVRNILFIAHGKDMYPTTFWDRTSGCPICTGGPENRAIVQDALARNYAVIAISALNPESQEVWGLTVDSSDVINVVSILNSWSEEHGLKGVPWVGFGASAGGDFISVLATTSVFESVAIMISGGVDGVLTSVNYPPSLFVHMPKDGRTADLVEKQLCRLRERGVAAHEVRFYGIPVTPGFFAERILGLSEVSSKKIWAALKLGGVLDEWNYLVLPDSEFDWQDMLRSTNAVPDDPDHPGILLWESGILVELRVAYARHVTFSLKDEEIYDWFDGAYKIPKFGCSSSCKNYTHRLSDH